MQYVKTWQNRLFDGKLNLANTKPQNTEREERREGAVDCDPALWT